MKNRIVNTYIVEYIEGGITKFVKLYVTDDFCYIQLRNSIKRISTEEAKQLTEKTQ